MESNMKPEDAFIGMTTTEWATELCRCLIKRKDWVQRTLKAKNTYDDFCQKILWWNNAYVAKNGNSPEHTATALYDICEQFGLIDLMIGAGLISKPVVTRGGLRTQATVRTRGATRGRLTALDRQLAEVGRLFSSRRA
jgi:hypothetical protein